MENNDIDLEYYVRYNKKKEKLMKMKNKEKGITLVALIITIIVLVILAAVAVNNLVKDKFLQVAIDGVVNYATMQTKEQLEMEELDEKLENTIEQIKNIQTDSGITITSVVYKDRTTSEIIAEVTAEDKENKKINYSIYTKTDETAWEEKGKALDKKSGETVTITANGLEPYKEYNWKIEATNGIGIAETEIQDKVRTYCPGTGLSCIGYEKVDCTLCNSTGNNVCSGTLYVDKNKVNPTAVLGGRSLRYL